MRRQSLRRTLPAGLAIGLLLFTALAPNTLAFRDPFDRFYFVEGPTSVDLKYMQYGPGLCIVHQGAPPGAELLCPRFNSDTSIVTPSGIPVLGSPAVVDTKPYNFFPAPHLVRIWVEHVGGIVLPDPLYGFSVTVCNDRDDDGECTNLDPFAEGDHPLHPWYDDQFKTQYSNPPVEGEPCKEYAYREPEQPPPTGEEKQGDPGKDSKDCGDPTDAEVWMCILPDTPFGGGGFDNLYVYVSEWEDDFTFFNEKDNLGAGISQGTYEVYVQYFFEEPCEPWD